MAEYRKELLTLALSFTLFFNIPHATGSDQTRNLTEAEARQLAIHALPPDARKLPKLRLDVMTGLGAPGFYWFEATAAVPNGSPVLGHFAVNEATGDVWDPVWCKKISLPDLKPLQRTMRKRIGISGKDVRRLSEVAPCQP